MINLRKPLQSIPSGFITGDMLAVNAIDLTSDKVTGELPNTKLAAIADINKIEDGLVTLAKVSDDVKLTPFIAGEEEQSVTGTTSVGIIQTGISKVTGAFIPKKIRIIATLKISAGTGYLEIYVDSEISPRLTLFTTSSTYELLTGEFSSTDLDLGRHNIIAKLRASASLGVVTNDYIEIYTVK